MDIENKSNIESINSTKLNSYVEDIGGNYLVDCNVNNEKDIKTEGIISDFDEASLSKFIDNFTNYADESDNIDFEKFDYNIYDEQYYSKKFPGFDDWVHKILAECSRKKMKDHRETDNDLNIDTSNVTISFD